MTILLMTIGGHSIDGYCGYFRLNYHRLLMGISGTILSMAIEGYWWLF
jgi:hypothetical protein